MISPSSSLQGLVTFVAKEVGVAGCSLNIPCRGELLCRSPNQLCFGTTSGLQMKSCGSAKALVTSRVTEPPLKLLGVQVAVAYLCGDVQRPEH